ncbi:glycosyltransferase [Acaryochloris sp. IP29b_bin.148]|uniref:glycosyltransferase n=1 Tax=Acaryochloris sp. IP29b_bin.148 TaxID=2969218 RepID=UPI003452DDB1
MWNQPFGLIVLESMACSTPVIGMHCSAFSGVIVEGQSGFICAAINAFVHKIPAALRLNRTQCRHYVKTLLGRTVRQACS